MFLGKPCSFIKQYINELNSSLCKIESSFQLSFTQKYWLSFCIMGILLTNSVCWARFERASLGKYSVSALSWMFHHSKIPWNSLLQASVSLILKQYGINSGCLIIDDSDKKRAKITKKISHTYKVYDKSTAGYFNGQTLVFLLLVTNKITLPVGFQFYTPDPAYSAWAKENRRLKKKKIPCKKRPQKPGMNPNYPKKTDLAYSLLERFKLNFPMMKIKAILVDSFYGTGEFMDKTSLLFDSQVISQVRANQRICSRGKELNVQEYFKKNPIDGKMKIRGGKEIEIEYDSARVFLKAHKKKRFLIALRYEGEKEYRYLVASDLSWRTLDIVQGYTLRWLVEVFFEDWKQYEGWGQLTKQTGIDGSRKGLILSLLLDHSLLLHPQQKARLKDKLPAATVGSLREKIRVENLLENLFEFLLQKNTTENLKTLTESVREVFQLKDSKKHMSGRELGKLEPSSSLKNRARIAFTYI